MAAVAIVSLGLKKRAPWQAFWVQIGTALVASPLFIAPFELADCFGAVARDVLWFIP